MDSLSCDLLALLDADLAPYSPGNHPGAAVRQFACFQLKKSFMKKFMDDPLPSANAAAKAKFLSNNLLVGEFKAPVASSMLDEYLLGTFREAIHSFCERRSMELNSLTLYFKGRTGPGASLGANGTDLYSKLFSSTLTCTSESLYRMYYAALKSDPRAQAAEMLRLTRFEPFEIRGCSRTSCVPKTVDIARTICTEPSLNMFFQLGLGAVIEDGLQSDYNLSFKTDWRNQQVLNRQMAQRGSVDRRFSTIDLSMASDSISLGLIEWAFPRYFKGWLHLLRSKATEIDGQVVPLNMVSTMGNGFTFPLQTLIFTCAVYSVYTLCGVPFVTRDRCADWGPETDPKKRNWGVFGDDIVVERRCFPMMCRILHLLGFTVNTDKSFSDEDFRESCGGDYYRGFDVRGVYCKSLSTPQARLTLLNRLTEWSADHDVSLRLTLRHLRNTVSLNWVPCYEGYDAGLRVPFSLIKDAGFETDADTQSHCYVAWVAEPSKIRFNEQGEPQGRYRTRLMSNPDGLLVAFLQGSLRGWSEGAKSLSLSTRGSALKRYNLRRRISSSWDWSCNPPTSRTEGGWWQRWETVVGSDVLGQD